MDIIDVNKFNLPESFEFDFGVDTFSLSFSYNQTGDFFTVDLFQLDNSGQEIPLVLGEKLMLNRALWGDFSRLDFPIVTIIPKDLANNEKRISWSNFGETVFLVIMDEGDSSNAT